MANAARDANFVPIVIGQSDSSATALDVKLDPVTNRVIVELNLVSDDGPSAPIRRALRDANFVPNVIGLADDSSGHTLSAAIDHRNGYAYFDVLVE